jgi:two-component system response regulator PrrA
VSRYTLGAPDQFVLVVDDDEDVRSLLSRLLQLHGFQSLTAASGREALALLDDAARLPSLIVLDLEMPVMDGRTFLVFRQQRPVWRQVPVIVVSAAADAAQQVQGLDVVAIHRKPVRSTRLLALVADAVSAARPTMTTSASSNPTATAMIIVDAGGAAPEAAAPEAAPEPPDPTTVPEPGLTTPRSE